MSRTKSERRSEVEAWRESGKSAARFVEGRGYSRSSLENWARASDAEQAAGPRFLRLTVERVPSALVVEIGSARIRVDQGFDADLLRDVVVALEGRTS